MRRTVYTTDINALLNQIRPDTEELGALSISDAESIEKIIGKPIALIEENDMLRYLRLVVLGEELMWNRTVKQLSALLIKIADRQDKTHTHS